MICPGCRFLRTFERRPDDCMVFGEPRPAEFMRRTDGLCGPAAKLWEPEHKETGARVRREDGVR